MGRNPLRGWLRSLRRRLREELYSVEMGQIGLDDQHRAEPKRLRRIRYLSFAEETVSRGSGSTTFGRVERVYAALRSGRLVLPSVTPRCTRP
jgi:hypothetical protein